MAVVGPGAIPDQIGDIKPALEGASEFEYVTILNPLSDDFAVRVAQDVPVNMPFEIRKDTSGRTSFITNDEKDARQVYGLNLKNPDFQARKHFVNDIIIKSGQTINLKGNEAQVAVRQLVNEYLQRDGHGRLLADPTLRAQAEAVIIQHRGLVQDLMDRDVQGVRNQIDEAINKSNKEQYDKPFPTIANGPAEEAGPGSRTAGNQDPTQDSRIGSNRKEIKQSTAKV